MGPSFSKCSPTFDSEREARVPSGAWDLRPFRDRWPRRGGVRRRGEGVLAMDTVIAGLEFAEFVKRCDECGVQPALDRACLLISAVFDPSADIDRCEAKLDDIAERAAKSAGGATDSYVITAALIDALFRHGGFCGNADEYNDPRNSLLSSVLERRAGIPITLSILLMEVARRVGLPLAGVGLPGHFVVRFPDA